MSTDDIASFDDQEDRIAHLENERQAELAGFGYPEKTRTLRFTVNRAHFEIFAAIESWSFEDGRLVCKRCAHHLQIMPPSILHDRALARCSCSAGFITAAVSPEVLK
jgi:hypothetical protein